MDHAAAVPVPANHTPEGGVLLGDPAARRLVIFEDPQCPYCRQFEESSGELLQGEVTRGLISVEYRMRCFLGDESVRADNALALAAEAGRFDELRREVFAAQPPEQTGGFTTSDLLELGAGVGLTDEAYTAGLHVGRYEPWVIETERLFQQQDPQGTPAALLDGEPVDSGILFDPGAFAALLGR
jgi:protein-disulfide isomerase